MKNLHKLKIKELNELLCKKKIKPEEILENTFKIIEKNKNLNPIVNLLKKESYQFLKKIKSLQNPEKNLLFAIPFATKDNIITKNIETTASSKILKNFYPNYDATVIKKLQKQGCINIAKTTMDELGLSGKGLTACTGFVLNPWNKKHITGGSSSGSAVLVAIGAVPFALGSDTGDSIRNPASHCGIVGYKPTYGLISRYGLIPYAPSLDTIGVFTKNIEDLTTTLDYLTGFDENDSTSLKTKEKSFNQYLTHKVNNKKICIITQDKNKLNFEIQNKFNFLIKKLKDEKITVSWINFEDEIIDILLPIYLIISCAEAKSCQSNLTGIFFGNNKLTNKNFEEAIKNNRGSGFGYSVKKRHLFGAYVTHGKNQKKILDRAKKIRSLITKKVDQILKEFDAFLILASDKTAPLIEDEIENRDYDNWSNFLLLLANFTGIPSLTIPFCKINNLPLGLNINTKVLKDQFAINLGLLIEKIMKFENELLNKYD
jgi:aspartyl-tRNA(Asn)/glutamyl-tRNA(Gln) amidotransferase subunit A